MTAKPSEDLLDALMEVYDDAINNGDGRLGRNQLEYALMKHDLCLIDARDVGIPAKGQFIKRAVAFRVPRVIDDKVSATEWRLFNDDDQARTAAYEISTEYQGLYVRDGTPLIGPAQVNIREQAAKIADPWAAIGPSETEIDKAVIDVRTKIAAAIRAIEYDPHSHEKSISIALEKLAAELSERARLARTDDKESELQDLARRIRAIARGTETT